MNWMKTSVTASLVLLIASPVVAQNGNTIGVVRNDGGTQPGYWLFAPLSANENTYLMDSEGRVVNEWSSSYRPAN